MSQPEPPPLIVLSGFMGTGKTETGRALAGMLGLEFIDTDSVIEASENMTIPRMFEEKGESYFRSCEEKLCRQLSQRRGAVVATGGGTLINKNNFQALSLSGRLFLLTASVDAIEKRIRDSRVRPLIGSGSQPSPADFREKISSLLVERTPVYGLIDRRFDTTHSTPPATAAAIAAEIEQPRQQVTLSWPEGSICSLPSGPTGLLDPSGMSGLPGSSGPAGDRSLASGEPAPVTTIEIGRGLLSQLGERLNVHRLDTRVFLLIPASVRSLHQTQLAVALDGSGIPWSEIRIDDLESQKTIRQAESICDRLAAEGAGRDSVIVAAGGGVTGDLGGFVSSIYMRGLPLVQVPTTLLAQADSSIGGKTGLNAGGVKNLLGHFYPARLVITDPCLLRTLPDEEISNGLAEIVKTAVIGSPGLLDFIESTLSADPVGARRDTAFLERCVSECARVKTAIVEKDPFDHHGRRHLNLGHTLGHAVESLDAAEGPGHGRAVAIGLRAAARMARSRNLVDDDFPGRLAKILQLCGLPSAAAVHNEDEILRAIRFDKKRRRDRYHFVLPVQNGSVTGVTIVSDVTEQEMLAALQEGTL